MTTHPPALDMRSPDLRDGEILASFVPRVFRLNGAFSRLSGEFSGIVPPGQIEQVGHESWGHRVEKVSSDVSLGPSGTVRSWRFLALTHEGLRVVEEEHLASPRGEESVRQLTVVGAPTIVTALRLATLYGPKELGEKVSEVAERCKSV